MNHSELLELTPTRSQVEELQQYLQKLENVWEYSITTLVENAFRDIRTLLQQAEMQQTQTNAESTTDVTILRERAAIFNQIVQIWLSIKRHFIGFQDATELLQMLEKQIYVCQARTNLYVSVALINESNFREYDADLMQQKASGFLALAETVDFFKDYLPTRDLVRVDQIAKQAIEISSRTVQDYVEIDPGRLRLETQIRAASYLIIEAIQHCSNNRHNQENDTHALSSHEHVVQSREEDCEAFIATFSDVLTPEEADRLRNEAKKHSSLINSSSNDHKPSEQDWDTFMAFLEDSQDDMGVSDLAHQHDHYLHGAPKRIEN